MTPNCNCTNKIRIFKYIVHIFSATAQTKSKFPYIFTQKFKMSLTIHEFNNLAMFVAQYPKFKPYFAEYGNMNRFGDEVKIEIFSYVLNKKFSSSLKLDFSCAINDLMVMDFEADNDSILR